MTETPDAMHQLNKLQRWAFYAVALGIVLTIPFVLFLGLDRFYQSYLMSYTFWFNLSLGSLGVLMIHHLAGRYWSFSIRRFLEAGALMLIPMAALFVPVIAGMNSIYYRWLDPSYFMGDNIIEYKADTIEYLTAPGFFTRTIIAFAVWIVLAGLLYMLSGGQDKAADGDFSHAKRMRQLSGIGVVAYVITMTFISVDWFMSIEPHFFSTMYGVLYMVGQGLATIAFGIVLLAFVGKTAQFEGIGLNERSHSIGKMLLAFVILWTYVSYGQYIIIWSGNLPEFTPWYLNRTEAGWSLIAVMLIIFHFAVPFFLLLSRKLKQDLRLLWLVAVLILLMRFFDIFWLLAPDFFSEGLTFDPLYLSLNILLGGLWVAIFVWILKRRPLLPTNELVKDPRVQAQEGHAHA